MAAAALAGTLLTAKAQMDAGKAQQHMYNAQAKAAEIKGRQDALAYKEQANQVLRERNRVMASAMARGGTTGFNFVEAGSPTDVARKQTMYNATKDFTIARDNEAMAISMASYNAGALRTAGANAKQIAKVQAFGTVAKGVGEIGMSVGGFGGANWLGT